MKPILEKIFLEPSQSIHVHWAQHPNFFVPLHYHPDIEIIHVVQSYGTSIVGNSVTSFDAGDLVMVGTNVPHVWKNDKEYYEPDSKKIAEALVFHFLPDCLGDRFMELPEMIQMRKLFQLSKRGIRFTGSSRNRLVEKMFEIYRKPGQERIVLFINLINEMSKTREIELLSSIEYRSGVSDEECKKINIIYDYLFKNYQKEVDFGQIASLVSMSAPSLCRYFKKHTHKTITDILNEIRVRNACKLLSTNQANAKEACYISGFNNYSHYNKQFKKIVGKTPFHYQKQYNM
jgi:AraC-like DNA-binding protein